MPRNLKPPPGAVTVLHEALLLPQNGHGDPTFAGAGLEEALPQNLPPAGDHGHLTKEDPEEEVYDDSQDDDHDHPAAPPTRPPSFAIRNVSTAAGASQEETFADDPRAEAAARMKKADEMLLVPAAPFASEAAADAVWMRHAVRRSSFSSKSGIPAMALQATDEAAAPLARRGSSSSKNSNGKSSKSRRRSSKHKHNRNLDSRNGLPQYPPPQQQHGASHFVSHDSLDLFQHQDHPHDGHGEALPAPTVAAAARIPKRNSSNASRITAAAEQKEHHQQQRKAALLHSVRQKLDRFLSPQERAVWEEDQWQRFCNRLLVVQQLEREQGGHTLSSLPVPFRRRMDEHEKSARHSRAVLPVAQQQHHHYQQHPAATPAMILAAQQQQQQEALKKSPPRRQRQVQQQQPIITLMDDGDEQEQDEPQKTETQQPPKQSLAPDVEQQDATMTMANSRNEEQEETPTTRTALQKDEDEETPPAIQHKEQEETTQEDPPPRPSPSPPSSLVLRLQTEDPAIFFQAQGANDDEQVPREEEETTKIAATSATDKQENNLQQNQVDTEMEQEEQSAETSSPPPPPPKLTTAPLQPPPTAKNGTAMTTTATYLSNQQQSSRPSVAASPDARRPRMTDAQLVRAWLQTKQASAMMGRNAAAASASTPSTATSTNIQTKPQVAPQRAPKTLKRFGGTTRILGGDEASRIMVHAEPHAVNLPQSPPSPPPPPPPPYEEGFRPANVTRQQHPELQQDKGDDKPEIESSPYYSLDTVLNSDKFFWVGRGGYAITHTGNSRARSIILTKADEYAILKRSQRGRVGKALLQNELNDVKFVIPRDVIVQQIQQDDQAAANPSNNGGAPAKGRCGTRKVGPTRKKSLLDRHGSVEQIKSYPPGVCIEVGYKWALDIVNHQLREEDAARSNLNKKLPSTTQRKQEAASPLSSTASPQQLAEASLVTAASQTQYEDLSQTTQQKHQLQRTALAIQKAYPTDSSFPATAVINGKNTTSKRSEPPQPTVAAQPNGWSSDVVFLDRIRKAEQRASAILAEAAATLTTETQPLSQHPMQLLLQQEQRILQEASQNRKAVHLLLQQQAGHSDNDESIEVGGDHPMRRILQQRQDAIRDGIVGEAALQGLMGQSSRKKRNVSIGEEQAAAAALLGLQTNERSSDDDDSGEIEYSVTNLRKRKQSSAPVTVSESSDVTIATEATKRPRKDAEHEHDNSTAADDYS